MKQCALKFVAFVSLFIAHCGNWVFAAEIARASAPSVQTRIDCACGEKTCTLTLVFPERARQHEAIFVQKTRLACEIAQKKLGAPFVDDFAIFFDDRPAEHNGLTTVIPTNRIAIYLESPELESSIGLGRDFLLETLVHEMAHMIVTQQRSGVFRALDWVVGNTSRPLGAWPRWLHEGIAVWTEAAVGGRPEAGIVDFDLRKYAEYVARTKTHPLTSSDLDGTFHSRLAEPGSVPYHFGYRLVDAWARERALKGKFTWGQSFGDWARSPGISFRIIFRDDLGQSLEKFFERERDTWTRTFIDYPAAAARGEIARAPHIDGPFRFVYRSGNGSLYNSLAWIERSGRRQSLSTVKGRLDEGRVVGFRWKRSFASPAAAFYLEDAWLVLYSQIPSLSSDHLLRGLDQPRRLLSLFDRSGRELCRFRDLPDRVREIAVDRTKLGWIRTLPDLGTQVAETANFDADCALTDVAEIARSREPFERLSGLWIGQQNYVLSRSRATAPFEVVDYDGREFSSDERLVNAYPHDGGLVVHRLGKDSFSAGYVRTEGRGQPVLAAWTSVTGSVRSAPASLLARGGLVLKESYWDDDRLVHVRVEEAPERVFPLHTNPPPVPVIAVNAVPGAPAVSTAYSPWASLWPQFWLPTLLAYSEGYSVYGQTFFADLRGEYSGSFVLGYDSYPRRPFLSTQLARRGFAGGWLSEVSTGAYYSPSTIIRNSTLSVLDRAGINAGADLSLAFPDRGLRLVFQGSARAEAFRGNDIFADRTYIAPALGVNFYSTYAQSTAAADFKLADARSSFLTQGRFRWIERAEWTASLQGLVAWGRTGIVLRADYAQTDRANYPLSYFEFGGQYSFATSLPQYVSRGFAPRLGTARELARAEAQFGFPLGSLRSGASFSRLRFGDMEGRVIAETLSFAPFGAGRFSLGRGYFTSVGAEINVLGTLSQYVKYSGVLGFYRGFGEFGENRVALRLSSYLDL